MSSFPEVLSTTQFLNHLNEQDNAQILEEDSDLEDVDTIPDLVLDVEGDLDGSYERIDGLVAYPNSGSFELHSFRLANPRISEHEASICHALRIRQSTLLVTSAREPDWRRDHTAQLFTDWAPLEPRHLEAGPNFVQSLREKHQQKYDAANIEFQYGGVGISMPGMIGLVRHWFAPQDIIDLYMASPRILHVHPSIPDASTCSLEKELFNTTKYIGNSAFCTVITYGRSQYGTIELYKITQNAHGLADNIAPVAAAKSVPKTILRSLKQQQRKIELLQKPNKIRYFSAGKQLAPLLVRVETHSAQGHNAEWLGLGQSWRRALGVAGNASHEGLLATIPQMMALLHLSGSGLYAMASTPVQEFGGPLECHEPNVSTPSCSSGIKVKRGVKITKGPQGEAHPLDRVKVAVMFPRECEWAHERLLWF